MKIQGPTPPKYVERAAPKERSSAPVKDTRAVVDQVQISSHAQRLRDLHSLESVDEARVARLREAIEKGTFKADAERIVDRILEEECP